MKFFIDTANLAQIKEANELGILDGVTTNPSLMAKEGIKGQEAVMKHYKTICEMVNGDISAEVISTDFKGIVEEGKKLAAIHQNIVVKVPMIKDGVKAIKWFTIMAFVQIVHFVFLQARQYLQQKQVLHIFLLLLAELMIVVGMVFS